MAPGSQLNSSLPSTFRHLIARPAIVQEEIPLAIHPEGATMADEEQHTGPLEPADQQPIGSDASGKGLSRRAFVAIAVVVVAMVAAGLWAFNFFGNAGQSDELRREALETSWKQAQKDEAPGVDFEFRISNPAAETKPALSFDHGGKVTVEDSCFEATSDYIVLVDGSLAIEDLTDADVNANSLSCESAELTPIFWTSRLSFDSEGSASWIAYGADGSVLGKDLKEQIPEAILEEDESGE